MRNDVAFRIPAINGWFKHLNALPRNHGAPEPSDQLLAFPREHRSAYSFNPACVVDKNVQGESRLTKVATQISSGHRDGRCSPLRKYILDIVSGAVLWPPARGANSGGADSDVWTARARQER